eukprot:1079090-Pelagomonas_calceolata.AAC.1
MLSCCTFKSDERICVKAEFQVNKADVPVLRRDLGRIKVSLSARNRAHHESIRAALVPGRGTSFSVCHPIYDEDAMTEALCHAIYSAILNTQATAACVSLPVWGKHMITDPYIPNPSLPIYVSVVNPEPSLVPTFATMIHNPALTRKCLFLSTPGTY